MNIRSRVRDFVVENFLYGEDNGFKDRDSFRELGIIDSTGILELISFLEQTFNIAIEDAEVIPENLDCIDNIVDFLTSKLSGAKSKKLEIAL